MTIKERIITGRQLKGLTQQELANLTGISLRTIQRIEAGESVPRSHTLKAIAAALKIQLTDLVTTTNILSAQGNSNNNHHFLQLFNLSCFTFLAIPFVHFLVPNQLLKSQSNLELAAKEWGRKIVRQQIWWIIALHLVLFLTFASNFVFVGLYNKVDYFINYLYPFFAMYLLNVALILYNTLRIPKHL